MFYVFIALSEACAQTQPAATEEEVPRGKMGESEEEGSAVTRAEDNKFNVHARPQSSKEKCCRTTSIHNFSWRNRLSRSTGLNTQSNR